MATSTEGRAGRLPLLVAAGVVTAAGLGATGCDALQSYAMPEVPIWVNHPGNTLSIAVRQSLTSEPRPTKEPYERGRPEIDAAHRRVFVPCSDGGLYAVRAED